MAYDHGSQSLGIKNPFKLYGFTRCMTGVFITLIAAYFTWQAIELLKVDRISGAVVMIFSLIVLARGIATIGSGTFQLLRFFVGRSVPISLAKNLSETEKESSTEESKFTAYDEGTLKSMLMARKNPTFVEPEGWASRVVHTIFPNLTFLPIPIRNSVQRLASAIFITLSLMTAFFVSWLVISTGAAGKHGSMVLSGFSVLLMTYLAMTWFKLQKPLSINSVRKIDSIGSGKFIFLVSVAIILPITLGIGLEYAASAQVEVDRALYEISLLTDERFVGFSAWPLLGSLAVCSLLVAIPVIWMIKERVKQVDVTTEVSESREHWQESIHPKELFINMDNMVLANRRYKEMPNRVYSEFTPEVNKQDDKGSFEGDLLIETQPEFSPVESSSSFKNSKLTSLFLSQLFILASTAIFIYLGYSIVEFNNHVQAMAAENNIREQELASFLTPIANSFIGILTGFFLWRMLKSFGLALEQFSKWMFAELRFESLLMYFKCEGTYTESKLSTGMSIHDSTRSENVVVRTNFTPWLITSRIVSNTFAQEGAQNIEHERHVMSMHQNSTEMNKIIGEIKEFLNARETLAKVANEKDLESINNIHTINEQTRGQLPSQSLQGNDLKIEEAAGFVRIEEANS